jgi:lysophospholipase L1-like esterase
VKVALRSQDADIDPKTAKSITFSGSPTVTIPAGATRTSDPAPFKLAQFADLAVSLYFPKDSTASTSHLLAQQSGYISPATGNHTAAGQFEVEKTIQSWPFLTGVDVQTHRALGSVVVFGDSTVDGDGSTPNANHRWPDEIARVLDKDATKGIAVLNAGIVGNRLLRGSPSQPPSEFGDALGEAGIARFERDALSSPKTHWVIVRLGINDIGLPGSLAPTSEAVTAADLIAGYKTLITRAHRHHTKIYLATLTPFEGADVGAGYYTAEKELTRQEVNAWIRASREFDGLIDVDAALKDPQHPSRLLSTYDSGDHLHPNDAGYAASAAAVTRQLLGID